MGVALMKTFKKHLQSEWSLALLFVAGLALIGSDGDWFPIPNLSGIFLVALFRMVVVKSESTCEQAEANGPDSILSAFETQEQALLET
jgi:hypothetical protein